MMKKGDDVGDCLKWVTSEKVVCVDILEKSCVMNSVVGNSHPQSLLYTNVWTVGEGLNGDELLKSLVYFVVGILLVVTYTSFW